MAYGKAVQYLPRLHLMATAPMVVNTSYSVNASNGLPALGQYIRRYSPMA
jgi:hypothetical protein